MRVETPKKKDRILTAQHGTKHFHSPHSKKSLCADLGREKRPIENKNSTSSLSAAGEWALRYVSSRNLVGIVGES